MKWATSAALMRGDTNGTLRPRYSATRAEIATIFKRFIEIKDDLEGNKPDGPLDCDHVWETTETAMVDVVVHEDEENWIYMKDVNSMSICNGCDLDICEIDYLENVETGEKIYVTMSNCRHPKFKIDRVTSNGDVLCVDCNVKLPTINDLYN